MQNDVMFPLERLPDIQRNPDDFGLVTRVPFTREDALAALPLKLAEPNPNERTHSIVFLDMETTGLDFHSNSIIELGMVKCTFSLERQILLSVDKLFDEYEDPKKPLSPEFTTLTGISNEMVVGKRFNEQEVLDFMVDHPLVVAHNASLDRPFFDKRFSLIDKLSWACSLVEIDWKALGYKVAKLEYLLKDHGYFYDSHQAKNDCLSLAYLLHIEPRAIGMLYSSSLQTQYCIRAYGAPFSTKDLLKEKGYRFDGKDKLWYLDHIPNTAEAEQRAAELTGVYKEAANKAKIYRYTAQERYKSGHD